METYIRNFSIAVILLLLTAACYSRVPQPVSYRYTEQQKLQAAYHWDVVARDVAAHIVDFYSQHSDLKERNVTIIASKETPFEEAFYNFLTSRLSQNNLNISLSEESPERIYYDIQVIYHRAKRPNERPFGLFQGELVALSSVVMAVSNAIDKSSAGTGAFAGGLALGAGLLAEADRDRFLSLPHQEVVITTSLASGDQLLNRRTDIYYISDADDYQYKDHADKTRAFILWDKALALHNGVDKFVLPQKALNLLNRAIELYPEFGAAYNNRGILFLEMGLEEAAAQDLKKARDLGVVEGYEWAKEKGYSF